MSISFYESPEFEDNGNQFHDHAAERNQKIADRTAELIVETLKGAGDFWPGQVRSDGAIDGPEWDVDQGNALLAALRDSFIAADDPAGAQLRYAKAISDAITDYAQRRAMEEIE